jgi:hypothetical protein
LRVVAAAARVKSGQWALRGTLLSASCRLRFAIFNLQFSLTAILALSFCVSSTAAPIDLPESQPAAASIAVSAESANRWKQGTYEIWMLRGNCRIVQGADVAQSKEAVLWIDHAPATQQRPTKIIAYLEGDTTVVQGKSKLTDRAWFGRFYTLGTVEMHVARVEGAPAQEPPLCQRAFKAFQPAPVPPRPVVQAQYTEPAGPPPLAPAISPPEAIPPGTAIPGVVAPGIPAPPGGVIVGETLPAGTRRIRAFGRSNIDPQVRWESYPQSGQWIGMISSGVNVIIDGLGVDARQFGQIESIDLAADRVVIWTRNDKELDFSGKSLQDARLPLEIYMEGNIVFRQGERTIYAERMYYDVTNHVGTVINAEVLTPIDKYEGLLRLHADVLQQTDRDHYFAKNAFVTSSRMGAPGYRLQSGDIKFQDIQIQATDAATGLPAVTPDGQPIVAHDQMVTADNNLLYLGPLPVFYWPTTSTNLKDRTFYLRRAQVKNDQVYGFQVLTHWNMYELLGIRNRPEGTDWDLTLDYLSKRGFGHGTTFSYGRPDFFGFGGPASGLLDFWGISDSGTDNLGSDRPNLEPEASYRYKLFGQHRQQFGAGFQLTGELGLLSDRNFLQEYYQQEWDELKDMTTGVELKRLAENRAWSITADIRVNDFFTQTDWLPRADHFWLGQSLLGDSLVWYEHSSIGYGRFNRLAPPSNPADQPFSFLPWERSSQAAERFATKHEIDLPVDLGLMKVVPYVLGEFAHWGADLDGQQVNRWYGQAGVRASLPMWSVDPTIESGLFNVHGVAHKVEFNGEFLVADASQDMNNLPLYDQIDDDSIEAFRRRLATNTFGSPSVIPPAVAAIPFRFDERSYALRTGLASWVTSPSTEIADDLMAFRLGVHQRWQTKRGMPGNQRIIDWIVFDTNFTLFPDPNRDNFGNVPGLLDYYARWHVGDRLTLMSEGMFDFFAEGQQIITVGGFLTRPPRGSLYLGVRLLEGPINSQILSMSYSYWMSPKWVSTFGMSVDFGQDGNLGQSFQITRIGESLLISAGFNVDPTRNNVGVHFTIEPRFLPKGRLGSVGGARIPPAGAFGLE